MERKSQEKLYPETIIINRMYAGGYPDDNIGHEIINTYQTDSGENYVYVNPWGAINSHAENAKYVLLVRALTQHCFEVIGYAGQLELLLSKDALTVKQRDAGKTDAKRQRDLIANYKIAYGGVLINDLFAEHRNTIFVTFKANEYRFAKHEQKLYIVDKPEFEDPTHVYLPGINLSKQSLRTYVDDAKNRPAYETLSDMLKNTSYWEDKNTSAPVRLNNSIAASANILDMIGKADDELAHSNWLAYYLHNDRKLLDAFAKEVLDAPLDGSAAQVRREYHNIDIWLEDLDNVIVIENKIKSGTPRGSIENHDLRILAIQSRLSKYVNIAERGAKSYDLDRSTHYYILLPDYSYRDVDLTPFLISGKYRIVRYSQLADFFDSHNCALPFYDEFKKAVHKHATLYKKNLLEVMEERFIQAIKARRP